MKLSNRLPRVLRTAAVVLALLAPSVVSTSADAASTTHKVSVKAFEFGFRRSPNFVAAGKVTFNVKNIGTEKHEMVFVRAQAGVPLPTKADGSVDEKAIPEADRFGEVENIKPKKTKKLTRKLPVGDYVLFCNLVDKESDGTTVSHYAEGMHAKFTVG